MPKVAIVYYSQTGQSQKIAESLQANYAHYGTEATLIPIQLERPYSFPWKISNFFEQMPYCMEGVCPEIEDINPFNFQDADRVVLVHPVWFLSASLPVQRFFKLPSIERLLSGKKVVQILTCRNMWFSAAQKTRNLILGVGAKYHGQLVFEDPSPNWASLITTPRWMFSGKKEAFGIFPAAGIRENTFLQFRNSGMAQVEKLFNTKPCCPVEEHELDRAKALSICLEVFGHKFIFKPWAKIVISAPRFLRGILLVAFRLNLVGFLLVAVPLSGIISRLARTPFLSYAKKQQLSLRGSV